MSQRPAGPFGDPRWKRALRHSTVGLEIGLAVTIGWAVGDWLDGKLGTAPYLMIVFVILGTISGMLNLYRAARSVMREQETDDEG